jgi:uncharacterized cysteine cluster protein YcgN (CxxCxxCC family)
VNGNGGQFGHKTLCDERPETLIAADGMVSGESSDRDRTGGRMTVRDQGSAPVPFWRRKSLDEMSDSEWESLCDGCGRCCLNKLEEEGTDRTYYTDVGCRLLNDKTCRCRDYAHRLDKVEDCVRLTPKNLKSISWLPPTCAYVLVAAGKDLYWWHPLVSGDPQTVHVAGISVRDRVRASETQVSDDMLEDYIVSWPQKFPKGARRRK